MPCWTIKKTTVNMDKMQPDLLVEGLKAAGFSVRKDNDTVIFSRSGEYLYHTFHKGVLELQGNTPEALTNEIKRAYSAQVVRHAFGGANWKLHENKAQQFVALKRR